ncbi:aminotransferase class III-fold pyridoxal phosphate-dependent enzyme [Xenorhabdus bovienii]|uniref:Zinc/cadmium/mercury/lead-transporting ATPase n=1 Tax=Xenorhabdus bovienii str. feltiae Moldova TaxID=1398200 RepID=A0A077NHI2_XENBV|nr:aminotransferase class III-fold pyridoxal phosphate-dependent enzyme [Xenorhabdus bovienii]CDH01567.1 Zinc/cadmium/mercury/lead-transporting ATPase [Xenorhabdus bovienii str. feltiae Moldova]
MTLLLSDYGNYVNRGWIETLNDLDISSIFQRAESDRLYDTEGNTWYDFISHYGATLFGHYYPPLCDALQSALSIQSPIGTPLGISERAPLLALNLFDKLALQGEWNNWTLTTGAEAVEGALKIAVTVTKRHRILARSQSFHGLSTLTLQLNDEASWYKGYETLVDNNRVDFFHDISEAVNLIATNDYAGVIIEPIQAIAGGRRVTAHEATMLRQACDNNDTLFIVDEIFTGMGRCGHYSAMQALDWFIQPDIILLSKTLTGGLLPSSQLVVRKDYFDIFTTRPGCARLIASTFSGNSLGHIVALESIVQLSQALDDDILRVRQHEFARSLNNLAYQYPELIQQVDSLGSLHFLHFISPEFAWDIWKYLHNNRILTLLCTHSPNTLKLICPINQATEAQLAICNAISYLCDEAQYAS